MAEACGTDPAGYVAESPGLSAYTLSDGVVYRTYVTTARGLEPTMGYYFLLDRTPLGRNEEALAALLDPATRRVRGNLTRGATSSRRGPRRESPLP